MVLAGSADAAGLAWLAERSAGRPVTLLLGDTRRRNFRKAAKKDRKAALGFLAGDGVAVRRWPRNMKSGERMHAKAFLAGSSETGAVLAGSANLTHRGLFCNIEMMAEASGAERQELWSEAMRAISESKKARSRLRSRIR